MFCDFATKKLIIMELFSVKRYAPEQKQQKQVDPGKENKLLEKLQGIIAKKKKLLEEEKAKCSPQKPNETLLDEIPPNTEEPQVDEEETVQTFRGDSFKILGDEQYAEKTKVKSTLPSWLSHPVVISNDLSQKNASLEDIPFLSAGMKENLKKMGIESLFPVQMEVIPWILNAHANPPPFRPRDICVSAPTGSGKTIAFALPIVELLRKRVTQKVRALVVLPVRELASQVFHVFKNLCKSTNLDCLLFSPNRSFGEEQQLLMKEVNGSVQPAVDIIVTTAGRLVEHLRATPGFTLKDLQFLVIDEADRIMEQIQNDWLLHLENHLHGGVPRRNIPFSLMTLSEELSKQPHKLLFSATLSSDPEKLENLKLFQPKLFSSVVPSETTEKSDSREEENSKEFIGKFTTPAELVEKICQTDMETKPLALFKLITENSWKRFLCFTNNNIAAHRLAFVLKTMLGADLVIEELSASLKKNARMRILKKFSTGKIHGLISSDTLARGIDVPNVDVVVCYDCPRHIRTYIHRVGRTARAGRHGMAVTLLCEEDRKGFDGIMKARGKPPLDQIKHSQETDKETREKYSAALGELKTFLKREKKMKSMKVRRDENTGKKVAKKSKKLPAQEEKVDPKVGKVKRKKQGLPGAKNSAKKAKMN